MEICPNNQTPENLRLVFQLAHDRNEKLISYVHITDGAIWGFIGLSLITLLNKGLHPKSTNVLIFLVILIVSMYLWRERCTEYQKSIVKGYNRMVRCEHDLDIDPNITIRKNLCEYIREKNFLIYDKPETYYDLCNLLDPKKYKDPRHVKMDICAFSIGIISILAFFGLIYVYHQTIAPLYVSGILLVVTIIFWLWIWYPLICLSHVKIIVENILKRDRNCP
jgi:hypothetical protein